MRSLWLVLAVAAPAFAKGSISNEIGINTTQSTPENPRTGNISDSLNVMFQLSDQFSLSLGGTLTLEGATPAATEGGFPTGKSSVGLFSAGVDWEASDHFTAGVSLDFSPQGTQRSGSVLNFADANGAAQPVNALIGTRSGQGAVGFDLGYDTAGESELEWAVTAGATLSHFDETQRLDELRFTATGRPADRAGLIAYCATHPCTSALRSLLREQPASLDTLRASLEVTATVDTDTDLTLGGDYYAYQQDPTTVGIFSVGAAGRQTVSGGNGVPIAPLRFLVKPEVAHRFGDFSAKVWVQGGRYVAAAGGSTQGLGTRLQYKATEEWKLWVTVAGQKDIDAAKQESKSGSFGFGVRYSF